MAEITLLELLQSGVHFGHQRSRWHPKMKPFIFTERSGIHIIDLEKTRERLLEALQFLRETAQKGGVVVFIGTKKQAQGIITRYAKESGMPFIVNRWIGGLLTNFSIVKRLIDKLTSLKKQQASGELEKYTKKEKATFLKRIDRLENLVGGLTELKKVPDALFVVDIKIEKTVIREAERKNIPVVAMIDTNNDPSKVTYPIPANDDATKSIELITKLVSESIQQGKKDRVAQTPAADIKDQKKE
ncbi:MAG: 30S ribosomal protein S2 [Patescibacteria group bacterium]